MSDYTNWKVGDRVVCVDDRGFEADRVARRAPVAGIVYTIRDIAQDVRGNYGIRLVELVNLPNSGAADVNGNRERGFYAYRFRRKGNAVAASEPAPEAVEGKIDIRPTVRETALANRNNASASQIADALGVTRNVIIGHWNRARLKDTKPKVSA